MSDKKSILQKINLFFWGFFIIWVCVGFLTALAGMKMPRWMYWADAWTMVLATIITYFWMSELYGITKTRISFIIILVCSGVIEYIGTNTGWPFGFFKYTDRFSSLFFFPFGQNGIAVIIPFAWAILCLNAYYVSNQILGWRNHWAACILAGIMTMLTDINLEPVAWYMRGFDQAYWRWYTDGQFTQIAQTIPIKNYISWFILTVIFLRLCPLKREYPEKTNWKPFIILLAFNLLFIAHRIHYTYLQEEPKAPKEIEFSSGRDLTQWTVCATLPFHSPEKTRLYP
ncbi:MAG: carotenoid biosynthesis protein [Verrucomicrobiota bacterium]|nr:carotenoid biosynthesis protein [Verrucomicrobiota bacterium]